MFGRQSDIQSLLLFDCVLPEFRVYTVSETPPVNKKRIIQKTIRVSNNPNTSDI